MLHASRAPRQVADSLATSTTLTRPLARMFVNPTPRVVATLGASSTPTVFFRNYGDRELSEGKPTSIHAAPQPMHSSLVVIGNKNSRSWRGPTRAPAKARAWGAEPRLGSGLLRDHSVRAWKVGALLSGRNTYPREKTTSDFHKRESFLVTRVRQDKPPVLRTHARPHSPLGVLATFSPACLPACRPHLRGLAQTCVDRLLLSEVLLTDGRKVSTPLDRPVVHASVCRKPLLGLKHVSRGERAGEGRSSTGPGCGRGESLKGRVVRRRLPPPSLDILQYHMIQPRPTSRSRSSSRRVRDVGSLGSSLLWPHFTQDMAMSSSFRK
ncbi:hypothetical protein MPTK1_8g07860 [Marchantia polymorpha subsp. ruderalis]|uniref:Uncharacterized protein n=1 Tax=Marchantia polymorpha TaxID=3197 RepID=A0A2R6XI26_MARPO|nr:hypothetical protein MARPO_0013s0009 [Marchantia polymorpha]BBN19102.1 hypothetical protein Mp_8g07860 [Marchantia polymorpha subsp. ruderalis]|eukprot:PTQ45743.1 hypothetical protein MARPO_0013s0009 [Marchantia polymorpha]